MALAEAQRLEAEAVERERQVRLQTYARDMRFAFNALQVEQLGETLRYLQRHQPGEQQPDNHQPDLRGFESHWLQGLFPAAERTLAGHAGPLIAADVSPDERWIASGDRVGVIKIRELATGHGVKTLHYDEKEITAVAFSPDGRTLATAGVDRTIRLWNVTDWSEKATLRGHELTVASITWSPDSRRLASGGRDHTIRIWNVANPDNPRTLPAFKDVVRCVAWSPSGEMLAAAVRGDGLCILNTKTWKPRLIQSDDGDHGALDLAFDQGGTLLASAGYGSRLYLHDVASHTQLADVATPSMIQALAFSADQRQLFAGLRSGELFVCDLHRNRRGVDVSRTFQLGQEALRAVKFPRSGQSLVTAHEQSGVVQTHAMSQFRGRREIRRYGSMLLAISAQEDLACTLDPTGAPQLASFPPAKVLGPLEGATGGQIRGAWFFSTGQQLLVMEGAALRLYDTSTRRHLGDLEASDDLLPYLAIAPSGRHIAASAFHSGEWKVCVWETQTRRRIRYLPYPSTYKENLRLAFSSDETTLALAARENGANSNLALWNVATGVNLGKFHHEPIGDLEFSPDGKLLALGRGCEVLLWNMADRSTTTVLRGHSAPVSGLAFSPCGRTLATVDHAGAAHLWHVPTRQEIGLLTRQAIPASNLLFRSPYQLVNYGNAQPTKPNAPCDVIVFDARIAAAHVRKP